MKRALKVALGLLGLAVAASVCVLVFLDAIVGKGIEAGCTRALGVETSVGWVRVGLLTGNFSARRLRIHNPPGFETDSFLLFDRIHFEIPQEAFAADTIVVPLLEIDGIDVTLETRHGKANYEVILANLRRFSSNPSAEPRDAEGSRKRFAIREAVIRDITARVDLGTVGGAADRVAVEIPELRLRPNKETGSADASVAELTQVIVTAVLVGVAKKAPTALAKGLFAGLGGLETVTLVMPRALTTGAEGVAGAAAKLGEGAVDAVKGLGGLFGRGDEDD